ncbi:NACHT domain-containing protein [Myroides fluvii]|uniref:NACHT domain-containing protein n=1 Tax=Myroides fluvii TaxID=2572594 RepID=UPI00131ECC49|nr:NACHT domain-containing protein [Myroides fluvii]
MLDKDKLQKLKEIPKETDIHTLLYELLNEMKYKNVLITHENGNVPEYGKDLIASRYDDIEDKFEWTAFVVKKGDLTGSSQTNMEIKAQVQECFDYHFDSLKHDRINISKVKIVTNGKINSGALQKFNKDEFYKKPNISFWTGDNLLEFIDKYYPRFWLEGSNTYKHYIEIFQQNNKHDDFTKVVATTDKNIKKILDNTIKQKLIEFYYDETDGKFKRKWFDVEDLNKVTECKLIVGESGSGKTTLFKQISNNIIFENSIRNNYEFFPIILKFIDLKSSNFNIETAIKNYFQKHTFKSLLIDVDELLIKKNYILFIDALDEIGDKPSKEKALEVVKAFNIKNPELQIICSSRNSDSLLGVCRELGFKYFEINGISMNQAESFLGRYFEEDSAKCKRLVKSLKDSRILDKLPKTPLTLTLLTSLFDENGYEIPATISDLYKYFIEIILNKNIKESHLDLLKVGIHRSILSYIAEDLHSNKLKSLSKHDLVIKISSFAKERGHKYNVNELIDDLVQNINILVENDRGEIEFKHLSFQEYFTAYQYYSTTPNGKSNFVNNFNDIWWQNVAIFYAGMTKDSPELIDEILTNSIPQEFHEYLINTAGLGYLIQALYNTPMNDRLKVIETNLENINKALRFIIDTNEEKYLEIKSFLHTSYGANKILAHWYEFHHSSITLKEPLESLFNEMISLLQKNEFNDKNEKKNLEYSTYLVASTLQNIEFDDFEKFNKLINLIEKDNYIVQGLIDSDSNNKLKELTKEDKRRKSIKKFEQRLRFLDGQKIIDNVNVSIKTGEKLKPLRKFKK